MDINFDMYGNLPPNIHYMTLEDFKENFCSKKIGENSRYVASLAMSEIIEWAKDNDALKIIIGGSFVSNKERPNDIDLLIVFKKLSQIPKSDSFLDINGIHVDVQMISMENENLLNVFLKIFSIDKFGNKRGIVAIEVNGSAHIELKDESYFKKNGLNDLYEHLLQQYILRVIKKKGDECKGLIIPIHGVMSKAEWMPELTMLASIEGWAVAPFIYGKRLPTILLSNRQKKRVLESLRNWISNIRIHYKGPISVVAHSFGTYLIAKYIEDGGDVTSEINSIILCGSILNENYNWSEHIDNGKVGAVLNVISQDDMYVKWMPYWPDSLFGTAGYNGFNCRHDFFTQIKSKILNHNNIIRDDIITEQWLPFLRVNRFSLKHHKLKNIK